MFQKLQSLETERNKWSEGRNKEFSPFLTFLRMAALKRILSAPQREQNLEQFHQSQASSSTGSNKFISKQWKNTNKAWAEGPSRYFIVGTSNTGKTTLACRIIRQLLKNEDDLRDQLVVISPNFERDKKLQDLTAYAASKNLTVMVYTGFDKKSMEKFVAYMDKCAKEQMRSTVFIDDPVGVGNFTSSVNQKSPFNSFITGIKHYNSDVVFSTQAIGSMSKSARKNIDVFIFMPDMISRDELYKSCRFVPSFEEFNSLMDHYASTPFHALWINVQYGRKGVYQVNSSGHISSITAVPQ